jgi:hypothetical protein
LYKLLSKNNIGPWIFSVLIALLLELPFVLLSLKAGADSPQAGTVLLFFFPSITIVALFSEWSPWAILVCQTVLISILIFWIATWRKRPLSAMLLRVLFFVVFLAIVCGPITRFEQQKKERDEAIRSARDTAVMAELEYLTKALIFYKNKYGEYPAELDNLGYPSEGPEDSRHAGLRSFPLYMEEFFTFTYTPQSIAGGKHLGYEIYADAKPGKWSDMFHYYSDQSGVIRFDITHDSCKRGMIVNPRPSVTIE